MPQRQEIIDRLSEWEKLLLELFEGMTTPELTLVRRIVEAGGRRVPISELVASLGLPPAPALEQDFPELTRFVAERNQIGEATEMPIVDMGSDEKGWYWMPPDQTGAFRRALRALDAGVT